MGNQTDKGVGNKRTPWIVGVAAVALVVIGYFTLYHQPVKQQDVSGTISGVKKAEKYRAAQIQDKDIALKNPELQRFLQSDIFRKLSNDAEFKAALSKSELQSFLNIAVVVELRHGGRPRQF